MTVISPTGRPSRGVLACPLLPLRPPLLYLSRDQIRYLILISWKAGGRRGSGAARAHRHAPGRFVCLAATRQQDQAVQPHCSGAILCPHCRGADQRRRGGHPPDVGAEEASQDLGVLSVLLSRSNVRLPPAGERSFQVGKHACPAAAHTASSRAGCRPRAPTLNPNHTVESTHTLSSSGRQRPFVMPASCPDALQSSLRSATWCGWTAGPLATHGLPCKCRPAGLPPCNPTFLSASPLATLDPPG